MYRRNTLESIQAALADTPVVLLNGARQVGKSTLAQQLLKEHGGQYVTLDDAATLAAARSDPKGFLQGIQGMAVIDEVQHAPALFPAIKQAVDEDRRPGRFLLTGSANVLLLPGISESLAGRMEIITLMPLSQGEILGVRDNWVDRTFDPESLPVTSIRADAPVHSLMLRGGFPEAIARKITSRRSAWFRSYVNTMLQRDVRELANIEGLVEMPRLLSLLAVRTSGLLNMAELSRSTGIAHSTLRRYLAMLETAFLYQPLPAWSGNLSKRLVKSPKIHLLDSGLASHLAGLENEAELAQSPLAGPMLESFIVGEIRKQLGWSHTQARMYHFRTSAGREVDLILERSGGGIVGIEVKSAAKVGLRDFAGLQTLAEASGKKFIHGIVLYTGNTVLPFGDRMLAVPISALWEEEKA